MKAAIVESFEARIESGADLDHRAFRMAAKKFLDPLIEHRAAQGTGQDPRPLVESLEIPIDGVDHFGGLGIFQDRVLPPGLGRAGI
jgi:hypothetical protein